MRVVVVFVVVFVVVLVVVFVSNPVTCGSGCVGSVVVVVVS